MSNNEWLSGFRGVVAPPVRSCDCCHQVFSGDEGQLGDICTSCGWECDATETCECGSDDYSSANHECLRFAQQRYWARPIHNDVNPDSEVTP